MEIRTEPPLGRAALTGHLDRALGDLEGATAPADAWRRAWLLTMAGRYGEALSAAGEARRGPTLLQACAAMVEGMVFRQVSLHERAEAADAEAEELLRRVGAPSPAVRAAIRIGQVADAVGLGLAEMTLTRRLRVAATATTRAGSWRQHVRLDWVRGEVAMLRGRFPVAARSFATAASLAAARDAKRHEAKSLVFLAASYAAQGHAPEALKHATRGLQLASKVGAAPLVWPAELVLAEVDPAGADAHLDRAATVAAELLATLPKPLRRQASAKDPARWLVARARALGTLP